MSQGKNDALLLGDGDGIQKELERRLFAGDLEEVSRFSRALKDAIEELALRARITIGAETVFAGGDDVLLIAPKTKCTNDLILPLLEQYKAKTGVSISFGIGLTIDAAYVNLRRAKARGGVVVEGLPNGTHIHKLS